MSFIATTPLIGKRLKATDYRQYFAEVFLLVLLGAAYMGIDDLAQIRSGMPIATVSKNAFALIGALGLYGIRLSSFIAMARRYRMPQTVEWSVFLITFAAMVMLFLFSGLLVKSFAAAHDYRFCYRQTSRSTAYIFAKTGAVCPALPADAQPY